MNIQLFTGPHLTAAAILLNLLTKYNLSMALEAGKPTLESTNTKSRTRLDNVFCSTEMLTAFIYCDIEEDLCPVNTDHFPIISILNLSVDQNPPTQRWNFCKTEWPTFRKALKEELEKIPPPREIQSADEFYTRLRQIQQILIQVVENKVPKTHPSPFAKRWWTEELNVNNKEL
ncbi:hypothetical protein BDR06DRAFT_687686 [Suillus hirtellus]|nr:hypothetical protein BDR06DRAFT_687686 [Suillus hirtellus]